MSDVVSDPDSLADRPLDRRLERCADGELSDAEERALLARLDGERDGWRELALRLLERRLLEQVCRQRVVTPRAAPDAATPPRAPAALGPSGQGRRGSRGGWLFLTAAAASLLAAFAAGRWTTTAPTIAEVSRRGALPMPPGHQGVPTPASVRASAAGAEQPRVSEPSPQRAMVAPEEAAPSRPREPAMPAGDWQSEPLLYVHLELPGLDEQVPVPVYPAPAGVSAWQPFPERPLSRAESEAYRRAGFQVRSARHLLQWASPQGDQIMVPIETIEAIPARY